MKNNPQVAIMMPVYNGENTLKLAIQSIKSQTYQNWKCYIVNDGSTDKTREILDNLNDERFVIHHFNENKGRPYARQAILDAAEGKYIAFLDADDFFHPEKLEKQVKILEGNSVIDLVSCGNLCYGNDYEAMSYRGLGDNNIENYNVAKNLNVALRTSLLKLELCKKIVFDPSLKHAQDIDFLEKYLPNRKFMVMDEILYYYSEFDSVGKYKIWKTYFYAILRHIKNFNSAPLAISKRLLVVLIKWILFTLSLPFISTDKILAKRGKKPTINMISEFKNVLNKYGI